jgi:RNA polymerase sigma-70 factor (ECF subfamily)
MSLRHEDYELAARMIAGDEAAFDRFSDHHIPGLYRFALRRLQGDRELTREVVQSTVCKAISKLETYRGGSALMTWLCAICRTEIALHFRKRSRRGIEVELAEETLDAEVSAAKNEIPSPEAVVLEKESAALVHVVLDLLPEHYSRVLEWKYLEGLSVKVMASRLEMSDKATESLLTRARKTFRDRYEEMINATDPESVGDPTAFGVMGAES